MEGLVKIGVIPERVARTEFEIIQDEPVYKLVRLFASVADMREIDGWARSFYTKEGHLEAISQYSKPLLQEPKAPEWNQAKHEVFNEMGNLFPPVKSLKFEDQLDLVPFESASAAGYGYDGKKGEGNNLKRAKGIANALVRKYDEDLDQLGQLSAAEFVIQNSTPDVAFTRTQLAKLPSIKVRNVFGEAFHYILIEGLSASQLLAAFKSQDTFYVTGKDPTSYVPNYLTELDQQHGWLVALDWSKFDATVQLWEIDHAFRCLKQLVEFPSKLSERAFDVSVTLFKSRKLAAPDGVLWMRNGGIPSGSYFTNLIGSIINYTRVRYACLKLRYPILSCRIQGDDSIMKVASSEKPDTLALTSVVAEFGWVLNPSKCMVTQSSEEVTFLGRSHLQLFNIRERLKVLRLMCFPEYKVDDPKISTARVRMIARDAGLRDPLLNKILYAMIATHGEAEMIPKHLLSYVDIRDWQDVNM